MKTSMAPVRKLSKNIVEAFGTMKTHALKCQMWYELKQFGQMWYELLYVSKSKTGYANYFICPYLRISNLLWDVISH